MKLVVQRVKNAKVEVDGKIIGQIGVGFLVLFGVCEGDTKEQANFLANKLCNLRVFEDKDEKMNLSLKDIDGELLIISQFTLYGDCEKGNRPSFTKAAKPEIAKPLYEYFMEQCTNAGFKVESGIFGAHMEVSLQNSGPVTIIMEK